MNGWITYFYIQGQISNEQTHASNKIEVKVHLKCKDPNAKSYRRNPK
jgi:hypothetical protein